MNLIGMYIRHLAIGTSGMLRRAKSGRFLDAAIDSSFQPE